MPANCKSRSISAPHFLRKQSGTPRRGPVPESGIRGNHAGAAPVSMGMIPRSMLAGCVLLLSLSLPHALGAEDRITVAIDNSRRVTLPGHVSPRTKSGVDQGLVDPSMELPYVTLALKPSAGQHADRSEE